MYCPDISNKTFKDFQLLGDVYSNKFNYVKVTFNKCEFKHAENVTCAEQDQVNNFFQTRKNKLSLFMRDTYIDVENHLSVLNSYVNAQSYLSYNPDSVSSANIYFRSGEIETDYVFNQ
jgi:hypothetical protein